MSQTDGRDPSRGRGEEDGRGGEGRGGDGRGGEGSRGEEMEGEGREVTGVRGREGRRRRKTNNIQ